MSDTKKKEHEKKEGPPPYTGWRPRSMRLGRSSSERGGMQRDAKRSRLGSADDRALYVNCKAHLSNPTRYMQLCKQADSLNGIIRKPVTAEGATI